MSIIKGLISEDSVNREEFSRSERLFLSNHLEISRRNSCGVSSEDIFESFLRIPFIVIAQTSITSSLVNVLDVLEILLIIDCCLFGMRYEESVMSVSSWMSLRLEEGIEIPEGALNVSICLHFLESHFE